MSYFVVYKLGRGKTVKEFDDAVEALAFAEEHGTKVYFEKTGVKYPDEEKEDKRRKQNGTALQISRRVF